MQNRRNQSERESRRSSGRNNYAAEDARRRFQDQSYDNYFPQQNYYRPQQDEYRGSQYGMESQFGHGMQQDYGSRYSSQQDQVHGPRSSSSSQSWSPSQESYGSSERWGSGGYERTPAHNWSPSNFERSSGQSWSPSNYEEGAGQTETSYFGKGPKGFKRSDERIKEEVSEALYRDNNVDASEIEVNVQNGEVTLSGTVENRHMKRLAEDCVENVSGVSDVRNELRVQSSSSRSSSSEESGSTDRTDRSDKSRSKSAGSSKLI